MTPEQTRAIVATVSTQLEAVQASLDAARAALAVLAMEADEEPPAPVASTDSTFCEHPDTVQLNAMGGSQRLCTSCGLNLTT